MTQRTALVSGGIGGIGTSICLTLHSAGYRVVALDLDRSAERVERFAAATRGLDVRFRPLDVTDPAACAEAVHEVESANGSVDALVNAAGITRDATLRKMDPRDWDDVIRVNLGSVFNLCRPAVEGMGTRRFGRIVNISSINGQTGQFGQTNYAAAKAGMHGFTMSLAREVARLGITVNSISPGYIDTEMTRAIRPDIREQIVAGIPVGRMGDPTDIARVVGFLCEPASGFITGANIPVNGGQFMSF